MKKITDEEGNVLFEGSDEDMTLAYLYLTKPFWVLAETRGLTMNDAYKLNQKYWTDKAKAVGGFKLVY
jgi:hypothetical protein